MFKLLNIIIQIALLFCLYFIGVWIQTFFGLFIPGSVIGLILLFILLVTGLFKAQWVEAGSTFMVSHLVLFFIPATVGLLHYYYLFTGMGVWLILITVISTLLVMVSSGLVSEWLAHKKGLNHE